MSHAPPPSPLLGAGLIVRPKIFAEASNSKQQQQQATAGSKAASSKQQQAASSKPHANSKPQTTNHKPQTTNHKPQTTNHETTAILLQLTTAGSCRFRVWGFVVCCCI
jgi:hypothetical protein